MLILTAVRNKDSGTHIFGWEAPRLSLDFWFAVRGDINGSIPHPSKLFCVADFAPYDQKDIKKKKSPRNPKQRRSKQTIWCHYFYRSVGVPIRGQTSHSVLIQNQTQTCWMRHSGGRRQQLRGFSVGTWGERSSSCLGEGWHDDNTLLALPPNSLMQLWPLVLRKGEFQLQGRGRCWSELRAICLSSRGLKEFGLFGLAKKKMRLEKEYVFPDYKYILENKCERRERRLGHWRAMVEK